MLVTRIEKVTSIMEETREQIKIIQNHNNLKRIGERLSNFESNYRQPSEMIIVLGEYLYELDFQKIKEMHTAISIGLERLHKDFDEIENIEEFKDSVLYDLRDKADELDSKIRIEWQEYIYKKNNDILDLLVLLENLVENKNQVLQLKSKIIDISKTWPIRNESLLRYTKAKGESVELVDSLNVTDEIRSFLNLVTKGDATLEDLNDTIIEWLKKHSLMKKIKIQPI